MKAVAIRAAKAAGKIMIKNYHKKKKLYFKGIHDFATNADKECERKIISIIKKSFPEHSILSEEMGEKNNGSEFEWVIDPIDGTLNYETGIPFCSTSIALVKNKQPILGVVYAPFLKMLYFAEKDKGSFLNGKKLSVSKKTDTDDFIACFGFGGKHFRHGMRILNKIEPHLRTSRRLGSAALEACLVASASTDAYFTPFTHTWDITAAVIIAEEAGAKVTKLNGKPWKFRDGDVVISNGKIHKEILKCLK